MEFEVISQKTGVPIEHIPNALKAYDKLFPIDGSSWLKDLSANSNILLIKMAPVPFLGIGANVRKNIYTTNQDYKDLKISGGHTLNDLIKWNNHLGKVLKFTLGI
jgi:hypothetical protein